MKYIAFDITNILYRTFYAHKSDDDVTIAGLAHHTAFTTLNKYFREFKPHKLIMCFDRHSWRKDYTASDDALTPKQYKGNRRQKMTPKDQEKYKKFLEHISEFEEIVRDHTTITVLAGDGLEADDLMAGVCQVLTLDEDNEIILVSADKDMIQLLKYPNVRLIDPASGKDRTLEEWDGDADLFMFEKCIRGDAGDNVQSALPRVKKTRIWKAYNDDYERANLMNETWTDPNDNEYVVKQLFKENDLLMNLSGQPEHIQTAIVRTVLKGLDDPGEFSYFHFMRFLGKYEMKKLAQNADNFVKLLSR
jgi:hypothetical protein